jgi:hypothetical protein
MSMADNILTFLQQLDTSGLSLPSDIRLIDPYKEDKQTMEIARLFYTKFYNDDHKRILILGINPGRFGGAMTGVPFTDPKRLHSACGIAYEGKITHEPSSVFVYEMINAFGGVDRFYNNFYINSLFPLAITRVDDRGKEKNYNYYDSPQLFSAVEDYIVANIYKQIELAGNADICFCFGTGKNETVLRRLNDKHRFFKEIISLEHPRFIVQYKSRQMQFYINKYLKAFNGYVTESR